MAAEMISAVLKAENEAHANEEKARLKARQIVEAAEVKSRDLYDAIIRQAESEASLAVTQAHDLADEIIKQAEALSKLRERKVISETEKLYSEMIKKVIENIV